MREAGAATRPSPRPAPLPAAAPCRARPARTPSRPQPPRREAPGAPALSTSARARRDPRAVGRRPRTDSEPAHRPRLRPTAPEAPCARARAPRPESKRSARRRAARSSAAGQPSSARPRDRLSRRPAPPTRSHGGSCHKSPRAATGTWRDSSLPERFPTPRNRPPAAPTALSAPPRVAIRTAHTARGCRRRADSRPRGAYKPPPPRRAPRIAAESATCRRDAVPATTRDRGPRTVAAARRVCPWAPAAQPPAEGPTRHPAPPALPGDAGARLAPRRPRRDLRPPRARAPRAPRTVRQVPARPEPRAPHAPLRPRPPRLAARPRTARAAPATRGAVLSRAPRSVPLTRPGAPQRLQPAPAARG